jgi:hypothetical protein
MNYSLIGGEGDESLGAAEFEQNNWFYAQNEMRLSDNFKLSYGVRVMFQFGKMDNADFNRTIPLLQAAVKNLQGAVVESASIQLLILHHVLVLTMI